MEKRNVANFPIAPVRILADSQTQGDTTTAAQFQQNAGDGAPLG